MAVKFTILNFFVNIKRSRCVYKLIIRFISLNTSRWKILHSANSSLVMAVYSTMLNQNSFMFYGYSVVGDNRIVYTTLHGSPDFKYPITPYSGEIFTRCQAQWGGTKSEFFDITWLVCKLQTKIPKNPIFRNATSSHANFTKFGSIINIYVANYKKLQHTNSQKHI